MKAPFRIARRGTSLYNYRMNRRAKLHRLKALADTEEDVLLIEQIEALRKRILKGGHEQGIKKGPSNMRADKREDKRSVKRSDEKGEEVRYLHISGLTFQMKMSSAPASLDTIIDVWIENTHMELFNFTAAQNHTILDIGANEGFYTLRMKQQNPAARVLAVEPVGATYQQLAANLSLNNCEYVYPVHGAAYSDHRHIQLHTYPLVSTVASEDIEALDQGWIDSHLLRKEVVEAFSVDELCRHYADYGFTAVDLLKIDVEGAELEVVKGAQDLLQRTARIVIEWHSDTRRDAVTEYLTRRGYRLTYAEDRRFGDLYFELL